MEYYINLVFSIFMFATGTMFGSFFSLATYRLPRHQDIVKTRSYCPNCKHKLGFFDCFPILSFISTIGRCKYCQKPISLRYPLMEFASGMVFLLTYLIFGFSIRTWVILVCYIYLFITIGSDIMKNKMTEEEKKEVEEIIKNKKTNVKKCEQKKNEKMGAINTEILVAVILFVLFFTSTIYITKNYSTTLETYIRKSNALNICLNNINTAKSIAFERLNFTSGTTEINGVEYSYSVNIAPYVDEGHIVVSDAKIIVSTVSYMLNGVTNSISLKSIKVGSL